MHLSQDEISRLSPDERLSLIAALWDSLDDEQVPLTAAQQAELDRRQAAQDRQQAERDRINAEKDRTAMNKRTS